MRADKTDFPIRGTSENSCFRQYPLNDDRPERQRHRRRKNLGGRHARDRWGVPAHGAGHYVARLCGRKRRKEKHDGRSHGRERKAKGDGARDEQRRDGGGNEPLEGGGGDELRVLPKRSRGEARPDAKKSERKRRVPEVFECLYERSRKRQPVAFPEEAAYGCQNQRVRDDAVQGLAKKSPTGEGRVGPVAFLPVHLPAVVSAFRISFGPRHRPCKLGRRERVADRHPHGDEERKERERFVAADTGRQRKADVGIESKPALKDGRVRYVVGSDEVPDSPGKPRRKAHRENARRKKDRGVAECDAAPRDREEEHRGKKHVEDELLGAQPESRFREKPGAQEDAEEDHQKVGKNEKKAGHGRGEESTKRAASNGVVRRSFVNDGRIEKLYSVRQERFFSACIAEFAIVPATALVAARFANYRER